MTLAPRRTLLRLASAAALVALGPLSPAHAEPAAPSASAPMPTATATAAPAPVQVQVRVWGAPPGRAFCALFSAPAGFPDRPPAPEQRSIEPVSPTGATVCALGPVALGADRLVAVAVFIDRDGDGKLSKNFLGLPREPYGFSGSAWPARLRAPRFAEHQVRCPASGPCTVDVAVGGAMLPRPLPPAPGLALEPGTP